MRTPWAPSFGTPISLHNDYYLYKERSTFLLCFWSVIIELLNTDKGRKRRMFVTRDTDGDVDFITALGDSGAYDGQLLAGRDCQKTSRIGFQRRQKTR